MALGFGVFTPVRALATLFQGPGGRLYERADIHDSEEAARQHLVDLMDPQIAYHAQQLHLLRHNRAIALGEAPLSHPPETEEPPL